MSTLRTNLVAAFAAILVLAVAVFVFSGDDTATVSTSTVSTTTVSTSTVSTSTVSTASTVSDLPAVTLDELPSEALETLALIASGGPYPYRQDDEIFQNREGILPDRPSGHYREFTVDTPGSPDRGARRIVTGGDGERYWTDDHYDSFREIVG